MVSKPISEANLLSLVVEKVLSAGELLIREWNRPEGPRGQGDKAEVDLEIEQQLRDGLLGLLNCDFWGEETGYKLNGTEFCWVVDPNDGTRDFLQGHQGSAISVGLLRNALPVLGVVYAPITDRGPDYIYWVTGLTEPLRNGQQPSSRLRHQALTAGSKVMMSMAALSRPDINAALCAPATVVPMPSIAYRLARVAVGDAVACASLVPVSAHDIVAGHALLIGAKGVLIGEDGLPISYTSTAQLSRSALRCFGGNPEACRILAQQDWDSLFRPH